MHKIRCLLFTSSSPLLAPGLVWPTPPAPSPTRSPLVRGRRVDGPAERFDQPGVAGEGGGAQGACLGASAGGPRRPGQKTPALGTSIELRRAAERLHGPRVLSVVERCAPEVEPGPRILRIELGRFVERLHRRRQAPEPAKSEAARVRRSRRAG